MRAGADHADGMVAGVRWGRALLMNLMGLGVLAWLATQVWSGQVLGMGAGLVMQGGKAEFSTAKLSTTNVGFGMAPVKVRNADGSDATKMALRMGFAAGSLDGFCFSKTETIAGMPFTLRVTSGSNDLNLADIAGQNVQFDVTSANSASSPNTSGNGIMLRGNVALGVTTQSVTTWKSGGSDVVNPLDGPESYAGLNGRLFGVDSDVGDLFNLKGDIYDALITGPISIRNLGINVVPGSASSAGCKSQPIPY